MTANQIEYWKLQETKRHNLAVESMDKPVKESQTALNYEQVNLFKEQAATQETVRALNLASAANQYAQAALNQQKAETEVWNTETAHDYAIISRYEVGAQSEQNKYQENLYGAKNRVLNDSNFTLYGTAGISNISEAFGGKGSQGILDTAARIGLAIFAS